MSEMDAITERLAEAGDGGVTPLMREAVRVARELVEERERLLERIEAYDSERGEMRNRLIRAMSMLRSGIKSGEPWTDECEAVYRAALTERSNDR